MLQRYCEYNTDVLSIVINIQSNLEVFKRIRSPYWKLHASATTDQNQQWCFCWLGKLSLLVLIYWILLLIILSGDVHPNPGPDSVDEMSLSSDSSTFSSENLQHLFSIVHLNVQSLLPKIDLVRGESLAYDVMVFTESWLNTNISNDSISTEQFH